MTRLNGLNKDEPSVYVDMSGNAQVLAKVHSHLGDALKNSTKRPAPPTGMPRGTGQTYSPARRRISFSSRLIWLSIGNATAWSATMPAIVKESTAFYGDAKAWIALQTHRFADMDAAYGTLLKGVAPKDGHIVVTGN